jgi:hypothetical protein
MIIATTDDSALPPTTAEQAIVSPVFQKYGEVAVAGFQAVPDLLLKNQVKLGLSQTDMVVLLNVLMHWWYVDKKPFPRATTIAKRIGVTPRTVQRSFSALEKLGLLNRSEADDGRTILDPQPLVDRLNEFTFTDTDYLIRRAKRNTA